MSSFLKSFTKSLSRNTLGRNLSFSFCDNFKFSDGKTKKNSNSELRIKLNAISSEILNFDWNTYNQNMCLKLSSSNELNSLNNLITSCKDLIKEDKYQIYCHKILDLIENNISYDDALYAESLIKMLLTKNMHKCNEYKTMTQMFHEVYKKYIRQFNDIIKQHMSEVISLYKSINNKQTISDESIKNFEKMLYSTRYMHELLTSHFKTKYYENGKYYYFQGILTNCLDTLYKLKLINKNKRNTINSDEIIEELLIYLKIYLLNYGNNDISDFNSKFTLITPHSGYDKYEKYNQAIKDKLTELQNINYNFKILFPLYKNFEFFYNIQHQNINRLIFKYYDKFNKLTNNSNNRNHIQNNNLQKYNQEYNNALIKYEHSNIKNTPRINTYKTYINLEMSKLPVKHRKSNEYSIIDKYNPLRTIQVILD